MDLENFAGPVIDAFMRSDDPVAIEEAYLRTNFAQYKNKDDFDTLMLCSFANEKFAMIKNDNDLIAFTKSGHSQSRAISMIPSQAGAGREQWAQLTLNKSKM